MNEKDLIATIKETLTNKLPDYTVKDFPIVLSDYLPTNTYGEILVKSAGMRPIQYIGGDGQIQIFKPANFIVMQYQVRIDLICKRIRVMDELYDTTQAIVDAMEELVIWQGQTDTDEDIEDDTDEQTEQNFNGETIGFTLEMASEPNFDAEKKFQFRNLIFSAPIMEAADYGM